MFECSTFLPFWPSEVDLVLCVHGVGGWGVDAEGRGARGKGRREGLCGVFQQDPSQI